MNIPCRLLMIVLLLAVVAMGKISLGQSAWYEDFEGTDPSWNVLGGDVRHKVLDHQRTGNAHTGKSCEWFRIQAEVGTTLSIAHPVGQPRVIEELLPTVWIKSDRPGLSISAHVVLPRTTDPRTNKALVTVVSGPTYNDVGRWQELRLSDMPKLVSRQIRTLHTQLGPNVDGREAYIAAILLNVYGGPGVTNVWIDDLDIAGYVSMSTPAASPPITPLPKVGTVSTSLPGRILPSSPHNGLAKRFEIKLSDSILMVDGRPFFPRVVEHRGEPLSVLKQLDFNAVWFKQIPPPEILEEADRLGLWLICPPPRPSQPENPGEAPPTLGEVGPAFDRVLIWDLGSDLTSEQLESTRRWAEQVRAADRRVARPLICKPVTNLCGFCRVGNNDMTLLVDRRPLGSSMELKDYGAWVRGQPLVARPGTPMWTTVQTQPNEAVRAQMAALDPNLPPPSHVSYEQMRLLAYTAVASGSRGLVFLSSTPLDAPDPATRQRAMALKLLNLELALVEPWAAAGSLLTTAESSEPEVLGTVLQTERSRLLLPIWSAPGAQCVPGQSAASKFFTKVPGVSESSNAYEMTPGGLHELPRKRVTLGTQVSFEEFCLTTQVLLAHDPLVINGLMRRSENIGEQAAQLQRHLAAGKYCIVQEVMNQLGPRPAAGKQLGIWLESARTNLLSCDRQLSARDFPAASLSADRSMRALRMIERYYWDEAVRGLVSPVTSPAAVGFETLPSNARLIARIRSSRFGPNILPGSSFDDFNGLMQSGWQHFKGNVPKVQSSADLVPTAARSGSMGVRLTATPDDPENSPAMLEIAPVRFVSPSVPVQPGQIVCIHGWVNVPRAITGTVDGLMIFDNQGGEALADRVGQTSGWRQFAMYRVVTQSGGVNVTFALTGIGEASIDDVGIEILEMPNP